MLVNVILVVVFDSVYDNLKIISFFRAWAILYPVCVLRQSITRVPTAESHFPALALSISRTLYSSYKRAPNNLPPSSVVNPRPSPLSTLLGALRVTLQHPLRPHLRAQVIRKVMTRPPLGIHSPWTQRLARWRLSQPIRFDIKRPSSPPTRSPLTFTGAIVNRGFGRWSKRTRLRFGPAGTSWWKPGVRDSRAESGMQLKSKLSASQCKCELVLVADTPSGNRYEGHRL